MTTTPHLTTPLGARLRAARGSMLSKDLAAAADWPPSKVSKIEKGRQPPTENDLQEWARIVGASPTLLQQWTAMLEQTRAEYRSYHDALADGRAAQQKTYAQLLADTTRYRFYEKVFMPSFLQTPAYARAVLQYFNELRKPAPDTTDAAYQADLDAAVAERMSGGRLLYDTHRQFDLLLDEGLLRTWRFSAEIMRGQLGRLESVVDLPNVRLGILPQNRIIGTFAASHFEMIDDQVLIELQGRDVVELDEDTTSDYHQLMDRLWDDAVTGSAAVELIADIRRSIPL